MTDEIKQSGARFYHTDDFEWREANPQMHGDRRSGVHLKIMEWNKDRMVSFTRYDPGHILRRHGHKSDSLIFIIEGDVTIGDRPCPAGTLIVLEKNTLFGPLVTGPNGCLFLESYGSDTDSVHDEKDIVAYKKMLADRGITELPMKRFDQPKS